MPARPSPSQLGQPTLELGLERRGVGVDRREIGLDARIVDRRDRGRPGSRPDPARPAPGWPQPPRSPSSAAAPARASPSRFLCFRSPLDMGRCGLASSIARTAPAPPRGGPRPAPALGSLNERCPCPISAPISWPCSSGRPRRAASARSCGPRATASIGPGAGGAPGTRRSSWHAASRRSGIAPGERVLILAENRPGMVRRRPRDPDGRRRHRPGLHHQHQRRSSPTCWAMPRSQR